MVEVAISAELRACLNDIGMAAIIGLCLIAVATVVLMTRMPRSRAEWTVGLITTVIASLAGGSFLIVKFRLHDWANDWFGMMALGGFYFVAGLPGWAIVRWIFNYINIHEDSSIVDVVREIKEEIKK